MKKSWVIFGTAVLTLSLTACAGNNDSASDNNNGNGTQQVQNNNEGTRVIDENRNHKTLTISERAEQQVEKMQGVDDAHVIIANNDAYVALKLTSVNKDEGNENNNGDMNGQGADRNTNNDDAGNKTGDNNTKSRYSKVSTEYEQKVADLVREADKKIHEVYVSANPDLYDQLNTYANTINTGQNNDSLFEDFNDMVNDFFGTQNN
ncbi:YhcN/YlaJ family sporulation lipoprotein [Mesobacillus maritimus]|uniref:YhcN/YlaJ family sporulation lipoprotein n=1 Tax=Mesobacillus maritimus TaxID=1643336 RepID=A0ABS7K7I0_9BACI|nr:YhcN/YlaJ family sporulation lipoprotein [Mesobacillus maritimus]MBY0098239.1 YhcN/YlaJ family sporulation lipoprotein [Mesobacillus maritimus]